MSFSIASPLVPSLFQKTSLATALTAIVLVAGLSAGGLGVASAQQGSNRQIQVLPAPGGDQAAPADTTPPAANAVPEASAPAAAAPADNAPPPQRVRPGRRQQAAPDQAPVPPPAEAAAPADVPPPVAVAPDKGVPVKGAPVLVEKPVKPVAKPKPRYHEREYGYQPRYEREYGGGGYGYGGSYSGGGGYGGGYGGGGYGGSRY